MATDPLAKVRNEIGLRVAEIRDSGPRLSPLDLYARMDAIRQLAALNGLAVLEGLARHSLTSHCCRAIGSRCNRVSSMSRRHSTATATAIGPRSSPHSPSAFT